jgi:hypothetical protein
MILNGADTVPRIAAHPLRKITGEIMTSRFRKITQIIEDMESSIEECRGDMDNVDIVAEAQNNGSKIYSHLDDLKDDVKDLEIRLDDIKSVV